MKRFVTICTVTELLLSVSGLAHALTTTDWIEYPSNPVYSPGKAYYPSILKEGNTYRMWSDNGSGVQMAISTDGIIWMTEGQACGLLNPRHTVVEKIGEEYRIWYDEGSDAHLYSIEAIRTATSSDGLIWNDDQPLTQDGTYQLITGSGTGWNSGSYGPGDVIYNPSGSDNLDDTNVWNNKYVMYYMATNGSNEYIGLAYSIDGKCWKRYGDVPVLSPCTEYDDPSVGWDYRSVGYPTVIDAGGIWHMWFCGGPNTNYGIGYAWSTDGINWVKDADNPIFHKGDSVGWRDDRTYTPMVIGDQMWFSGKDADTGIYAIGYATAPTPCTPVSIDYLTEGPLLAQVNTEVSFEATIVGGCGQIDALWDFDDGTVDSQTDVTSPVTATNIYTSAGIYNVVLSLSDDSGSGVACGNLSVVVYDPTGGFVTGGGWIDSPFGAYTVDPTLTGRANFGFVSKYKQGAIVPTGNTEFRFQAADLNFHSSNYQWLVVNQGGSRAQFKGSGTINGTGDYKFMLRAGDGEPDTFWLQIWEEISDEELLIYDNGSDQSIGGGSIVIQTGNGKN